MAKTFLDYTGLTKVLTQLKSYIDAKWGTEPSWYTQCTPASKGYVPQIPSGYDGKTTAYYSPEGWKETTATNLGLSLPDSGSIWVENFAGATGENGTDNSKPYLKYKEGNTIKSTIQITASGSITTTATDDANSLTIGHSNNMSDEGTVGPSTNTSLTSGGTFTVPYIKYSKEGHIKEVANRTMTLPTISAGGITSASGTSPISADVTNNALTITHDASGVTGTNVGPTKNATLSSGGTFTVPYLTYNTSGHITGVSNRTMTMPTIPAAVTDYIPKSGGTLNSGAALTFTDGGKYLKGDSTNSGLVTDGRMTATSFYESSDANLKENIQAPTVSAEDVEIKEFNFKGEDNTKYGVIAQQVQEAGLENLVQANDEGVLAVDYISLSMLMISDLRKQVAELKAEIAELKK